MNEFCTGKNENEGWNLQAFCKGTVDIFKAPFQFLPFNVETSLKLVPFLVTADISKRLHL